MNNNKGGLQFIITGRVQGVFYRRFAKHTADALQISGWVRNLPNGSVEIQAFGTAPQLAAYQTQLQKGPSAATVENIQAQSIAWEAQHDFNITY